MSCSQFLRGGGLGSRGRFSASWFGSGYVIVSLRSPGYCFRLQCNAWSSVVHAMRQSPGAFGQTAQKTVDVLQLPFIAGRRFPVVVQRAIPMVLPLEYHRDSAVAVLSW